MARQLLSYWKPETAEANLQRRCLLNHSASNQYGTLGAGDTVWLVTVHDGTLYLLGRILVARITDQEGAVTALGTRHVWEADYHILADTNTCYPISEIPIHHLAPRLRFQSRNANDRLILSNGRVNPQQLQRLRVLTATSAELLEDALGGGQRSSCRKQVSTNAVRRPRKCRPKTKPPQDERSTVLETLQRLQDVGRKSIDLVKPEYRDLDRSVVDLNGLCYVLSECLFHLFPGLFTPYRIPWGDGTTHWGDGTTHWFLRYPDGEILDAIAANGQECCRKDDYERAQRRPFFTKTPSKRAIKLLARAGLEDPTKTET